MWREKERYCEKEWGGLRVVEESFHIILGETGGGGGGGGWKGGWGGGGGWAKGRGGA